MYRLRSTERRLERAGPDYSKAYGDQIMDMVERSVARKLTDEEMDTYDGPIHYIPHHEVLKPNSKSTPVRIVFDSSSSYMGHVLNEYWAKGPNVLNDLLGVIIRFRQRKIAIAGDITKMYNAIKLSERDQHTHRFVWRDLQLDKLPDQYVLTSVTFGDRPSGAISTMALRMTAEMHQTEYPKAAELVIKNSYVDDLLISVNTVCEAKEIIQDTEMMLSHGGFRVKHWIISGDQSEHFTGMNVLCAEQENILGMCWLPKDDVWTFKAKLNFSSKRRGIHLEDDLKEEQLHLIPDNLTHRMVLSQVAGIYDPLGLIASYVLYAKILMRSMCSKEIQNGWDEPMNEEIRVKWMQFFRGLYELQSITFKRCIMPENAEGDPILVIFSDGSQQAYGACAYIRWHTNDNTYESNLVIAKNRIAPAKQLSTPRLELCGAVLASRLHQKLVTELDFRFSKIVHIVDSMIVRAQIRESYGFGTFVATRVAEIQSKTDPTEWWWVQGDQNPADMTTRVASASALGANSKWQRGPDFLKMPFELWPITQETTLDSDQIPNVVGITMSITSDDCSTISDIAIDIDRFAGLKKLLGVTSIVLSIFKWKTFKGICDKITMETLIEAEMSWVKHAQKDLPKDWMKKFQRLGPFLNQDGVVCVGQRMAEWIKQSWNQREFVCYQERDVLPS
ncbi:uncharacterized protein LOC130051848 [Ostrea edulis]|uniref:uncharacterized protein LOC130051848 n=1 Tax=Ostrea edulis TaxID=37623 RepID=UPI0024AFFA46|nr:uncharacterized protein LOC130051848 [Ostrea edulis]